MNYKYIPMNRVIENVHRDYGFDNLNWIDCVEWIGECLDLIGAPLTYIEKATDGNTKLGHQDHIEIKDSRGSLPCDMHKLIGTFKCEGDDWLPMRVSTDTTHLAYGCSHTKDAARRTGSTYKLNNNHIFTEFEEGKVMMVYLANPTDEHGYPMVPDNIKYIKACQAYVADKVLFKRDIQGRPVSGRVIAKIEQDLAWYTAAADSSSRIPTMDQMESWKNNFVKLIPNINSHAGAFRSDGQMEQRFNNSTNNNRHNFK